MIETILVPIFWILLGVLTVWFLFFAQTTYPMSLDDLALTWRLHKQRTNCKSGQIKRLLKEKDEVVGFRCECGFEFKQKCLITHQIRFSSFFKRNTLGEN